MDRLTSQGERANRHLRGLTARVREQRPRSARCSAPGVSRHDREHAPLNVTPRLGVPLLSRNRRRSSRTSEVLPDARLRAKIV